MRDIGDIVPEIVKITLLGFRYQWPKDPMNDKSATVSQSQGRHKHPVFSDHRQMAKDNDINMVGKACYVVCQ